MGTFVQWVEDLFGKPDSAVEGRQEDLRQEDEREDQIKDKIAKAQSALAGLKSDEAKALQSELAGSPETMDPQKLDRIVREAKELAAEESQQQIMGGIMAVAGFAAIAGLAGAAAPLAMLGVKSDGKDYPESMLGSTALLGENAKLPALIKPSQEMYLGSTA